MKFSRSMIAAALVALSSFAAGAAAAQDACSKSVQGVIAFDGKANKTWTAANLQTLCRGAEGSPEPGRCFARVMGGTVSYGGGTSWVPANALRLCTGATDSNARISCFESKLSLGWSAAIDACAGSAAASLATPQKPVAIAPKVQRSVTFPAAPAAPVVSCAAGSQDCDRDGVKAPEYGGNDCDDRDARRYPGANEVADVAGVDEDCNATTFGGTDADSDGYESILACNTDDTGVRRCGLDCDDSSANISPRALDILNDRDDDCDGQKDEDQTAIDLRRLLNN